MAINSSPVIGGMNSSFPNSDTSGSSTPTAYSTPASSYSSDSDYFQPKKRKAEEADTTAQPHKKAKTFSTSENPNSSSEELSSVEIGSQAEKNDTATPANHESLNDKIQRKLAALKKQQEQQVKPKTNRNEVFAQKIARAEDERLKNGDKIQAALEEAKKATPHNYASSQNPSADAVFKSIEFNREAAAQNITATVHAIARTMQDRTGKDASHFKGVINGKRNHPNDKVVYDTNTKSLIIELERECPAGKEFPISRSGFPENKLSLPLAIPDLAISDVPENNKVTIKTVYPHEDFALRPGPKKRYTLGTSIHDIEKEHGFDLLKASKLQVQMFAFGQIWKQNLEQLLKPRF